MEYNAAVEKAIDFIEQNLKNDIGISDCARISGYSVYHFLRMFKKAVGLTPADYIRKRRLSEIAKEMLKGNEYISELAFHYGFNSKENFLRAFKSEHHILPTEYKAVKNSLKLYERFSFQKKSFEVIPSFVFLEPFGLVVYPSDEASPPDFWNKYNAKGLSRKLSGGKTVMDYGVSSWNASENRLSYYIGIRKEEAKGDTAGTVELAIRGGLYAVFSTPATEQPAFVGNIHRTWEYINHTWLVADGFRRLAGYEFECYIEESRLFSEDIYIPVAQEPSSENFLEG